MHKSKLAGFIIDCQTNDLDSTASFWGAALGMPTDQSDDPAEANYVALQDRVHGLTIEVQRVDHASRVHLDIESDDLEAEVARLVALGAKSLGKVRHWYVMEAPSGQRFCVVRPCTPNFEALATTWP